MQVGIALPNFARLGTREAVVEVARRAESLGYDSVWTTDHVMMAKGQEDPYGHILEALTTLSYLAALTDRVKLGISVIVLPQREPVLFAKQIATIDVLSGGRTIVGLGAGWNDREFAFLGADFASRGKRLDEYIGALRELWTSPDPRFDGQYVRFGEALFSPRPLQRGGPPIVIGGISQAALRRSATLADGWHATGIPPERFAAGAERIRELANGRRVEPQIRLRTTVGRKTGDHRTASGAVQTTLSGSPDEIVERLAEYQAAGLAHLVLWFDDASLETFVEQMERFASEITPRLD